MSRCGAFIREQESVDHAIASCRAELDSFKREIRIWRCDFDALRELVIYYDSLITRYVYLCAIGEYISHGGISRGSYLIIGKPPGDDPLRDKICLVRLPDPGRPPAFEWENVRPIPESEQWFEAIYNK